MRHVARLRLHNWLAFQGSHELEFGPAAYAVVARHEEDEARSNWLCKSGFLESIRFALYGTHRHGSSADAWITRGEKEGLVQLSLDDGFVVTREKSPGKSAKLWAGKAEQDEAQRLVLQKVGLSEEDFVTLCYLEQGQTAKFVTEDPAPRTRMVVGWLRIEPIQRCHKSVGELLSASEKRSAEIRGKVSALDAQIQAALNGLPMPEADASLAWAREEAEKADAELAAATEAAKTSEAGARARVAREELERVLDEGKRLTDEYRSLDPDLDVRLAAAVELERAARDRASSAKRERDAKLKVATGTFGGTCPVAGIECPAKDRINQMGAEGQELLALATRQADEAARKASAADDEVAVAKGKVDAQKRLRERIVALAQRAKQLRESLPPESETRVSDPPSLEAAQAKSRGCRAVLSALEAKVEAARKAALAREAALGELSAAEAEAGTFREAQAVLGPQGAQRRLAEGALGKIEAEANFVLGACGVPLSLRVSWEREGKDPAAECPKCGLAFSPSAREKVCRECGEPRGKNRIQRLDVAMSNVSGAAEALGGLSAAFGASAWLRRQRDSQWGAAMLDEPLAACDKRVRQQVGTQLREMLGFAGFGQAFVVSHDAMSVSALPGRILVTGRGEGENVRSRIEVAA